MSQTLGNIVSKMGLGGTSPPFVACHEGPEGLAITLHGCAMDVMSGIDYGIGTLSLSRLPPWRGRL